MDSKEKLKILFDRLAKMVSRNSKQAWPDDLVYEITTPKNRSFGDFAVNIALIAAASLKENPRQLALALIKAFENLRKEDPLGVNCISRIEAAGPGFLNVFLTEASRGDIIQVIEEEDESFGFSRKGKGEKVLIEFVSANPTGPLTIAHGRQAAVGETLARLLKAVGYDVHKEFYLNDAGRQINLLALSLWARYRELHGERTEMPEEGYQGGYLIDIAKKLRDKVGDRLLAETKEKAVQSCRQFAVETIMNGIAEDLAAIGVVFDRFFEESKLHETGEVDRSLEEIRKKGHLFEEDGALWFRSSAFGDDKDRVIRKKTGEYTYLTADIAYHASKFRRGYRKIINLWGPDHHGYIPRLKAACEALGFAPSQVEVLIVQLTTLYRKGVQVRMSTRAGEFVSLRELSDEVGPDATRFFFLMRRIESHLDFDLELAKEKSQDNPVYYLQYAHARISSILEYAGKSLNRQADLALLKEPQEVDLLKKLSDFPDMLKQAACALEPYHLVDYLRELAALFHQFYGACRVVGDDEKLTDARLILTDAVRIVLRNGLRLLGISQPEKM